MKGSEGTEGTEGTLEALILEAEAERVLRICNACRYCESYCAVFPAMTRRLDFAASDVHYLANLCHNCGACLHACQYALPHEFAVNVPQALARVRTKTWCDYAWPHALARLYWRNGLSLALALAASLSVFLALAAARTGSRWLASAGGFYALFPHSWMVAMFTPLFAFALLSMTISVRRFWRAAPPGPVSAAAAGESLRDVLALTYLGGGHGEGCNETDDRWTLARRRYHHLTFYGFLLCFASTCVAATYHYAFGRMAPYGWTSLPKLLGVPGGLALVLGSLGLAYCRWHRHPQHQVGEQRPTDMAFIGLLLLMGASGLALALARGTAAMPVCLCVHLGAVMAFFATMPYGKFAHAMYRSAALLKYSVERRRPSALKVVD